MVFEFIGYFICMELGVQICEEMLKFFIGFCCDLLYLLVQVLCYLGLVVCFVFGYLVQLKLDVEFFDGFFGVVEDFIDLYVWVEVYLFGVGWIGLDFIFGLFVGEGYIFFVCIFDLVSVVSVIGVISKCEVEFEFENVVDWIYEDFCVIKLYIED